jgi:dTDP-4-amino-4,6-dideoxygalactose transaminase
LPDKTGSCNGHLYYIVTRSLQERNSLIHFLKGNGIKEIFHYVPLHSSPAGIKYGSVSGSMAVTDSVSERIVRLPLFYEMTFEEVQIVAEMLSQFYHGGKKLPEDVENLS